MYNKLAMFYVIRIQWRHASSNNLCGLQKSGDEVYIGSEAMAIWLSI